MKFNQRTTLMTKIFIIFLLMLSFVTDFGQNNNRVKSVSTSPSPLYQDFHLIIPKLDLEAPVIADVDGANQEAYFTALENGIAHFQGTSKPGEGSNIFIFGHSSFYWYKPGNYKEIFKNLENLQIGDGIILWYQKKEYQYQVTEIKVVNPQEIDVLKPSQKEQVSLMTCVPPGTTLKRLIVIAQPLFN